MDRPLIRNVLRALLLLAGFAVGWFGRGAFDAVTAEEERLRIADAARGPAVEFEIELFAPASGEVAKSMLCLLDGEYGQVVQDGVVYNRDSHVDFGHYTPGSFTAGIQGGEEGQIFDLGDATMLEREYGGSPLSVMRWRDGALFVEGDEQLAPGPVGERKQPSPPRRWLAKVLDTPSFAQPGPDHSHAQVRPDHVYFVRIARGDDVEIAALLQVLEYDVGSSVKLRCAQL